mgnify:CR=1 FL=1
MGIAALVLGIISLIIGFIPLCGSIALLPAIIGLILGIVDTVQKKKKGEKIAVSVTGLVLSAIAVVVIIFWVFVFGVAASKVDVNDIDASTENFLTSLNELSSTYEY